MTRQSLRLISTGLVALALCLTRSALMAQPRGVVGTLSRAARRAVACAFVALTVLTAGPSRPAAQGAPRFEVVGDMLLDVTQATAIRRVGGPLGATFLTVNPWPNGIMPVVFQAGISEAERSLFMTTCERWMAESPFRCVNHTTEPQFALVRKAGATACQASVGRPASGNAQIDLVEGFCWQSGIILHEIGHALGLHHEHQRADRDKYIWVDATTPQVIARPGAYIASASILGRGPYDFESIMHYGDFAVLPKPAYAHYFNRIGGAEPSAGDKVAVRSLYGAARADDPPAIVSAQLLTVGETGMRISLSPATATLQNAVSTNPGAIPQSSVRVTPVGGQFDVNFTLLGQAPVSLTLTLSSPGGSYDIDLPVRAGPLPDPTPMPPPGQPTIRLLTQSDDGYGVQITPSYGSYPDVSQTAFFVGSASGLTDIGTFTPGRLEFGTLQVGVPSGTLLPRHYIRARVRNTYGEAASGELVTGNVDPPTLAVTAAANPVTLTWEHISWLRASTFKVVVGSQPGDDDVAVIDAGLAFSLRGNAPVGRPLFIRVVAVGRNGEVPSNEVRVELAAPTRPPAPVLLPVTVTGNTASFAWTGSATSYRVLARSTPQGPTVADVPVERSPAVFAGVPAGTYYVSVVGVAGELTSSESNQVVVSVNGPQPLEVPVLQPARVSGALVELDWLGAGSTFEVRARLAVNGPIVARISVQGARLSVPGVGAGSYFVSVVSTDGTRASDESNIVRVDVQ